MKRGDRVFLLESNPILEGVIVKESLAGTYSYEVQWSGQSHTNYVDVDRIALIPLTLNNIAQQPHYTQWKIQPITFISANKLNFCQGNVIKYVMRYNQKNGIEDLKKAKVYIDYMIQELETGEVKP